MKRPRKYAVISDEYGPFSATEVPVQHVCSDRADLTVFELMMLLRECPGEACVRISSGDNAGINVTWKDGYFCIPTEVEKPQ